MPRQRSADRAAEIARRRRRLLAAPVLLLLLAATASNVYLAWLYIEVHSSPPAAVDTFCNLNDTVNCVSVAASRYSSFLGIPIAVYGAEYFGLASLLVLVSLGDPNRLRHWDSLVLWMMILGLPVSLGMAYLSVFRIRALCILCSAVYGANLAVLLLLSVANRTRLGAFAREGPRELRKALRSNVLQLGITVVTALAVSQFFWVPDLFAKRQVEHSATPDFVEQLDTHGLSIGPPKAPVQIEEFSDFQCPHCARAHGVLLQVAKRYPRKVRIKHFDYPLDDACNHKIRHEFHPYACQAAFFARCAAKQGKFWQMALQLFHHQRELEKPKLREYARKIGLSVEQLEACAKRPSTRQAVLDDIEEGIRRKLQGTPTVYINSEEVVGPRPLSWWEDKIGSLLDRQR